MAMLPLTGEDRERPNQGMGGQGRSPQVTTLRGGSTAPILLDQGESGRLDTRLPGPTLLRRKMRSNRLLEKVRHKEMMGIWVQFLREFWERREFTLKTGSFNSAGSQIFGLRGHSTDDSPVSTEKQRRTTTAMWSSLGVDYSSAW